MPPLTAQKLANELQKLIVKHPEAANWPVIADCSEHDEDVREWEIRRVMLDLSTDGRRFIVE